MRTGTWANAPFLRLWAAASVSEVGSAVTELALPLTAIVLLRATPLEVGLLSAAEFLPFVLVGLPAGVLADRSAPIPLLIVSDVGRAVLLASVPLAFVTGHLTIVQLYVVALLTGGLTVLSGVAEQTALHRIVPQAQLLDANSKLEISHAVGHVAGPGIGGLLIAAVTAPIAVVVDSVSFLVSAVLVATISGRRPSTAEPVLQEGFVRQVREGLSFIFRHPVLRSFALCLATSNFFGELFFAVYLVYLVRGLNLTPSVIGVVLALAGFGGVVGAASATRLARWFGVGIVILVGAAAPVTLALVPLAPTATPIPWIVVGGFLSAFFGVAFNVNQRGLRQALTPARLQGRMTATMRFLIIAPVPIGAVTGGFLGTVIGLRPTLWIGALGSMAAALPILLSPTPRIRTVPEAGPADCEAPAVPVPG
jgi:predicted MFS family arabinose efflux permease